MKTLIALVLCTAAGLSLWLLKLDRGVPGTYTRWAELNMTRVWAMVAVRWLVFSLAYILLLASGRLSSWVSWGFFRVLFVLGGVFLFELAASQIHYYSVSERLGRGYNLYATAIAVLLPACLIAAGWLPSRRLFVLAVAGSLAAWIAGSVAEDKARKRRAVEVEANQLDVAAQAGVGSLLIWADPMYGPERSQKALDRIAQQPNWIHQVAQVLEKREDRIRSSSAMFVLCRQPALLDEALQEKCWSALRADVQLLDQEMRDSGSPTMSYALQLREAVRGLASFPSPVRERHRDDFTAARALVSRMHAAVITLPEVAETEWIAAGADAGRP